MTATHVLALALLWCGCAALLLSAAALALLPTPYGRLHALAPATSLGVPLLCLALAVDAGAGRQAAKLLVIGALTAVSGPVTTMVIGRSMAAEDRAAGSGEPQGPPA
ncbi:cation:proton antiporter [Actinacidiphila paucisporea]|uniref:Monovalent cation/proton antiporter, MnhG/PhaG subunit n=1 Tax=Actinacidiphila paucisporea TaxID=310782 RepID=A0A1M7FZE2_9ACTN|nr:monovalent cation/H(+) antiporter subunit G [Actinacidiphila paucisporea]SHM09411.1 monovalent cation/proton antiporter, MnhG/PhaG subunit [Actinacidiphila paucisporea]